MPATRSAEPKWLNAEEMSAWVGYLSSLSELQAALEADLAPHGLSLGDYEVLVLLSESAGELRMCDLARGLRLSPSGLTRRLDGLVRGGLVRREPSESDRRVMLARLTAKGRSVLAKAAPDHVDSVRRHFLDHLTCDEVRQLAATFAKVREALHAAPSPCP